MNQLKQSLSAINSALDTTKTTNRTDFFHSLAKTITEKLIPLTQHIYLTLIISTLFFMGLYMLLFFLRKKEFSSFQLMGEKKSRIYFQLVIENLLLVNGFLFILFLGSIFFRAPLAAQLNQIEQELLDQKVQNIVIKTQPITEKQQTPDMAEGSIYESGVSHFNMAVVTETSTSSTIEPQYFSLFVIFINFFTLICLSPAAIWFLNRSGSKNNYHFV